MQMRPLQVVTSVTGYSRAYLLIPIDGCNVLEPAFHYYGGKRTRLAIATVLMLNLMLLSGA